MRHGTATDSRCGVRGRLAAIIVAVAIASSLAGCGSTPPLASPTTATSFDDYASAYCLAWGTLFRVVGNPETASWSDTVHQLQAAAEAHDDVTAARLENEINKELEDARRQIAYAASWPPASRPMAEMDRFFAAMETWISAYADIARRVPNAPEPQAALEGAGGLAAWQGMFETATDIAPHRPASVAQCSQAPVSP